MSGRGVVDAHVHAWDPRRLDYPWLAGVPVLDRPFLPPEIDRGGVHRATTGMVFVEADSRADQALDETRWVLSLADAWPELAAIVARADLRSGSALDARLDALAALPDELGSREMDAGARAADAYARAADTGSRAADTDPRAADTGTPAASGRRVRVVGIRHSLQNEPDDLLADARSRRALVDGLHLLAERGLTFDVCVRHPQLDTVIELLEGVPELAIVLDHLGKPPVDAGIDTPEGRAWAAAIDRMARLPLAHVKLSGLAAEACDTASLDAHAEAFLVHALRSFGPHRAMLGSDWPVSALTGATGTFAGWRERMRRAARAAGADDAGVAAIEHETATRFYTLT